MKRSTIFSIALAGSIFISIFFAVNSFNKAKDAELYAAQAQAMEALAKKHLITIQDVDQRLADQAARAVILQKQLEDCQNK